MFGLGSICEKISDTVGLPEWMGDAISIAVDFKTGNFTGLVDGMMDLAENCGIDVESLVPPPLLRAGMMYLQSELAGLDLTTLEIEWAPDEVKAELLDVYSEILRGGVQG